MKLRVKVLWLALVACSFSVAAAAPTGKTQSVVGGAALDSALRESLTGMRVQYQMDTLDLKKDKGLWWVTGRGLPAEATRLDQELDLLYSLHRREVVSTAKKVSLEQFGLQAEEARTVQLRFASGSKVRLRLGMKPGDPATTYWKYEAKPEIFRVPGRAWSISADVMASLDRHLMPDFWPGDLASVEASWVDSTGAAQRYKLIVESPDTVWMVAPDTALLPRVRAWEVLSQTNVFAIDAFMEPDESVPASSDSTVVSIKLVLQDGRQYTVQSGASDGRFYYLHHPQYGTWVKVLRARLNGFRLSAAYLKKGVELGPAPDDGITRGLPPPGTGVYAPHRDHDDRIDGHGHHGHEEHEEHDDEAH